MKILRPHSIGLTAPIALIGYSLTHTDHFGVEAIFWMCYSILWGFVGNLHNSVVDYKIDVNDPFKKHFPLVSGDISITHARHLSTILLIALWLIGIAGTGFDPKWSLLITFGIAAGLSYNWSSKSFGASGLMAGLAFPVPFLLAAHDITNVVTLVYAYLVIQFMLQNGLSGGYKDLVSDGTNMVKSLGVTVRDGIVHQTMACGLFSFGTRMIMFIIIIAITIQKGMSPYIMIPFILLVILVLQQVTRVKYNKKKFMISFVLIEMVSYYLLITAVQYYFTTYHLIFMVVFPPVVFVIFNKISWGTKILPKT